MHFQKLAAPSLVGGLELVLMISAFFRLGADLASTVFADLFAVVVFSPTRRLIRIARGLTEAAHQVQAYLRRRRARFFATSTGIG